VEAPYLIPDIGQPAVGSLCDYLGYPTEIDQIDQEMSAFPPAAYLKVYDDWFRHEYLQSEISVPLVAGLNNGEGTLKTRAFDFGPEAVNWRKDYYTACLPFAQAGDPVSLPSVTAPELEVLAKDGSATALGDTFWRIKETGVAAVDGAIQTLPGSGATVNDYFAGGSDNVYYDPQGTLYVNPNAEAVTINTLRNAFAVQSLLERFMRGGQRYIETMYATFGEKAQDFRLQRSEIFADFTQWMVISEVLSTAQTEVDSQVNPVGQMAGHGISVGSTDSFSYHCREHGWIIGVISVTPDTAYSQGLHRSLSRKHYLDYYWPDFAHLGEQAVLNKEVYANHNTPNGTFGYIPPFEELRTMQSRVAGLMRTDFDFWHFGRIFNTDPSLNAQFISAGDVTDRVFAVQDGSDHIVGHIFNHVDAVRKLPYYGVPSNLAL